MSCRLLVMLVFIIVRLKSKLMISSSSLNHIEDCFYEKRIETSLNGYNDLHDQWISELDCLARCLKPNDQRCRSFEHWRAQRHGLCVRANISLTDQPSTINTNLYVDYYEIDCRKDTKAVRLQTITCPGDHLHALVTLNGIDSNYVLLGDSSCKPIWSNETHAQFMTHVDNCSLILTDGSIVGKLRWEGVDKDTNEARQYERFFLCPSDIYQIRQAHWTSTTSKVLPVSLIKSTLATSSPTHRRPSSTIYNDERPLPATYRIKLKWSLHDQMYSCPQLCSLSLFSLIYITFDDSALIPSRFAIESCDLVALHPYSNYLQTYRLIDQGCSTDPSIIYSSAETNVVSRFDYSFHLYSILKEPIPFQIQCKILNPNDKHSFENRNCSLISQEQLFIGKNEKRDYSYTLFHSSPIAVLRHLPTNFFKQEKSPSSNSMSSTIAVQHLVCSLLAFSFLLQWTFP